MVFKLDPLDIELDFERRPYRLGDTIKATVTLIPNSDVEIRTASLSLMGQVRRTKVNTGWAMDLEGRAGDALQIRGQASRVPTQAIPSQTVTSEVFYSTQITLATSLRKDAESRHNVAFKLDPKLYKLQRLSQEAKRLRRNANRGLSIEPWWLEVQVDVVRGRDAIVRRQVEIIAPLKTST